MSTDREQRTVEKHRWVTRMTLLRYKTFVSSHQQCPSTVSKWQLNNAKSAQCTSAQCWSTQCTPNLISPYHIHSTLKPLIMKEKRHSACPQASPGTSTRPQVEILLAGASLRRWCLRRTSPWSACPRNGAASKECLAWWQLLLPLYRRTT